MNGAAIPSVTFTDGSTGTAPHDHEVLPEKVIAGLQIVADLEPIAAATLNLSYRGRTFVLEVVARR